MPAEDPATPRVVDLNDLTPTPEAPVAHVPASAGDLFVLGAGGALDAPADAWFVLDGEAEGFTRFDIAAPAPADAPVPEGARVLAYRARSDAALPERAGRGRADPAAVRANRFVPLFETDRAAAALISIAEGRRMDAGPESERAFLILEGTGLVFLQNEETLPFAPGQLAIVPPGEPARVWARGPGDARLIVFQSQAPPAERRTLAGEVRRRLSQRSAPQDEERQS